MGDKWLTVEDAAEQLSVNPETIRRWLRSGKLAGVLLSRAGGWRIRQSSLDAFMDEKAEETGKAAA